MRRHAITTVVLLLTILVASSTRAQTPDLRQQFANGYSFYSTGNFSQAKELLDRVVNAEYLLADYAIYYLASIAYEESNWDAARNLLVRLRHDYPQTIWYDRAELQRIKIDIAEQKYAEAVDALKSLRSDRNIKADVSEEALYLQAQCRENQQDLYQAYSLFQELRGLAPLSRWTALARKDVARLRDKYPDDFGLFTATAMGDEADRLTREREYAGAEALYKRLLSQDLGASLRLEHLTKLANLYLSVRKRNEAIPVLQEIAKDFSAKPEAADALYRIGNILWNRHDNGEAIVYFTRLMENYPGMPPADKAQFAAADILESQGRYKDAVGLYSSLPKKFPNSQVRDDATWRLAWLYYRTGARQDANATFKLLAAKGREDKYRTAALYWQARTAEQLGDKEVALRLYRNIFNSGLESYYQSLAAQGLARAGITAPEIKLTRGSSSIDPESVPGSEATFHLSRARELNGLKLNALAIIELDEADRIIRRQQPRLRPLLLREYTQNNAFARSVAIANQLPEPFYERIFHQYPLAYWETIQEKAREQNLDPYLVVALIRQESLFDARARSPAVALGLMQLLPSTANRIAKQRGLPVIANESLFDPEINVTLGSQYLRDLLQRYSNNWFKAIAAYNAGEAAVDRWEKEILTDDIEEFVERIPYLETRQYVKLVMRNHKIYKSLYSQSK